ncbi:MAG: hypothetical protein K2L35_06330 [Muribaculaceae bacterium]|nr:hypothetical protein [Muribaculaceae bacterium]
MAKKSEIIGEYIVTIHDNGSVEVSRIYKSTKKALIEIWTEAGLPMPEKEWNTQEWGRRVLKELCGGETVGTVGEYTIEREENNRINVIRKYGNTKAGLREVAKELNFLPDPNEQGWNTQRYGAVLVEFAHSGKMPPLKETPTEPAADNDLPASAPKMKEVTISLYGEGTRLDVFDSEEDLMECHNAMRDSEYFRIAVFDGEEETEYSCDDLGSMIYGYEWPEEIYDEAEAKFLDPAYEQFADKTPSDVFDYCSCDLEEAEDMEIGRIEWIQTKIQASVTIEIAENEKFDPKKFHFLYNEFVVPDAEIEVNTGVVYDGRQYDIELDIDSEREISSETIWEA